MPLPPLRHFDVFGETYRKNSKSAESCCLCGRAVKNGYAVRVIEGGSAIGDPNLPEDFAPGDMYFFAIGPECAKKVPKEYLA